jgi:hypothetical protein
MRLSNRDWIAWSILAAMAVIAGAYYAQQRVNASSDVYRIVVTAERPAH